MAAGVLVASGAAASIVKPRGRKWCAHCAYPRERCVTFTQTERNSSAFSSSSSHLSSSVAARLGLLGSQFRPASFFINSSHSAGRLAKLKLSTGTMAELDTAKMVKELRETFRSGKSKSIEWRTEQLTAVLRMITECEQEISQALFEDIGKPSYEAFVGEISIVIGSCRHALKDLKSWMAPQKVSTTIVSFPSSGEVISEPLGVALVISAWNFPFLLSVDPVIGAIAAGNCVVLKPSEISPATSALLAKIIPLYLDSEAIRVVEGGISETTALLNQKWDKIFYTGSTRVGRIVMAAAAKHLTPVVLELGGKCPVIVDSTAELKVAARRIASGKWAMSNGQACISPDYILAEDSIAPKLVTAIKEILKEFYGEDPSNSKDLTRVVNAFHFTRLTSLLDDIQHKIIHGGTFNKDKLYIEPTLILDPPMNSNIMSEEIFGPLLPIITVGSVDDAIEIVNSKSKPLALYVFTRNKDVKRKVIAQTSAGGMTVNDTILHVATHTLPFGGVGESGMGSYHGKYSFDAFSHKKGVLYRGYWASDVSARFPPYNNTKLTILRSLLNGHYLSLLKTMLGF